MWPALLAGLAAAGWALSPSLAAEEPAAADSRPAHDAAAEPSYEADVRPILASRCLECHGAEQRKAELDLSTPEGLLQGGESGAAVEPGKPDESLLYEMVHEELMPAGDSEPLSEAEVETIRRWIAAGARVDSSAGGAAAETGAAGWHEIQALMLLRCTVCHGARQQEGGLDLSSVQAMLAGGDSGPALVPGKPDKSLLLERIHAGAMPPRGRLIEASVKPMAPAEIEKLTRWIRDGAVEEGPGDASVQEAPVSDGDRQFWSFQPPRPVDVPAAGQTGWVRNPVDAFIAARLDERGLAPSAEAPREVLLRRAYFDLTGLPPQPGEVETFLSDPDPAAYEKLIDRLLASQQYGERWGRHWLDLAGYADSEGKREQDLPRRFAWRYRDYVIRSFNADKPYDRFLLEQLAGDELADYEQAAEITEEIYDNLVATGFLRMAPDSTWANITGFVPDRLEVVADELDVLGSAVMGLSIKCARCHSHKFDPLSQRDYFRLVAVFKGAYDEHDWLKPQISTLKAPVSFDTQPARLLPYVLPAEREAWLARERGLDDGIARLRQELERQAGPLIKEHVEKRLAELPEVLRDDVRKMLETPAEKRSTVQMYLAGKFESSLRIDQQQLSELDQGFKEQSEATARRIDELTAQRQPEPAIRALWDRGDPTPAFVYRRGDYLNPGPAVEPGVPAVLADPDAPFEVQRPWPGAKQTGRRLAFARWLTRPNHPLTARVMVNRIWKHHFGEGLVRTLDNFGKAGERPTHPELLDWLAIEFVRQGWSVKAMHRLMMTSSTYRQSSAASEQQRESDPDNQLLSRMPMRRMEAEVLLDTLASVAGRLYLTPYGPPDPVSARADGLVTIDAGPRGWRRGIYVQQWRKQLPTLLEAFDLPQMNPNCVERSESIVAPQALHLLNDSFVRELAGHFAQRVQQRTTGDWASQVEQVYLVALGRKPTGDERQLGADTLARLAEAWQNAAPSDGADVPAEQRALTSFCHTVINTAEFLYID
ncbi:MAG: PSD1 and planctomycete cytochrome C domain-containing protein [Pirellulales bacterium]